MSVSPEKQKAKSPIWIGILVLTISVIVVISASALLYRRTITLLTENLRERILTISITGAASLNAEDLRELQVEDDWKKLEWQRVVNRLHKIKYSNKDIVFMYIFRYKDDMPNEIEFVADADSIDPYANTGGDSSQYVDVNRDGKIEPDGPDKLQWPGQDYPEAIDIPETAEAYYGPVTSRDLYTDAYGTVLTGYAPIKDDAGNTVAILATDIKADDFFTITRQTLQPFLIFIVILTLIISTLIIIIIITWKRYAESLEKLNYQIELANEGQANLLHIMNHQIKGYLSKSRSIFSELLTEPSYNACTDEARPLLNEGFTSLTEGVNFVQNFLNASNIDRGMFTYNMVPADFKKIVEEITETQKDTIKQKGLTFELNIAEGNYQITGDIIQLGQAVRNLLDNAMHYTLQGSVSAKLERAGDKVVFSVKDTGVGLSDEVKPKLFTKGGRDKDSQKININSTGFGLAFVKGVAEAHKGRVWAKSEGPGKGATFYMELPLAVRI